jgi:hypothetical protein
VEELARLSEVTVNQEELCVAITPWGCKFKQLARAPGGTPVL